MNRIDQQPTIRAYQLGTQFILLPGSHEIAEISKGEVLAKRKLEPKTCEVLLVLIEQQGKVVSRESLVEQVWENYGGGAEALIQAISKIRKAFGDRAKDSKVIETIPKKGYRFILKVQPHDMASSHFINLNSHRAKTGQVLDQENSSPTIIVQQIGVFTGFLERLSQPRFLLAFLLVAVVTLLGIGMLTQLLFWLGVAAGAI